MKSAIADVRAFHERFGVPVVRSPVQPPEKRLMLRMRLHDEEDAELDGEMWALNNEDVDRDVFERVAKELVDSIYVRVGTALETIGGDAFAQAWDEVHRSNMTKEADPEGGKVRKGQNYSPPNIAACLWTKDDQ
jgi:predicted HAD superfamily Cof-like phosphohydrolase